MTWCAYWDDLAQEFDYEPCGGCEACREDALDNAPTIPAPTEITYSGARKLIDAIDDICAGDFELRTDYSGRGMFGKRAAVAVVVDRAPSSRAGNQLLSLGLRVDRMADEFVYYTAQHMKETSK